jgi:phosphatidylinositol transfer protein SFH5
MGYVTTHKDGDKETVITWNIYGAVKDNKKTFGDVEAYVCP